jgi:hypothetical protein
MRDEEWVSVNAIIQQDQNVRERKEGMTRHQFRRPEDAGSPINLLLAKEEVILVGRNQSKGLSSRSSFK